MISEIILFWHCGRYPFPLWCQPCVDIDTVLMRRIDDSKDDDDEDGNETRRKKPMGKSITLKLFSPLCMARAPKTRLTWLEQCAELKQQASKKTASSQREFIVSTSLISYF